MKIPDKIDISGHEFKIVKQPSEFNADFSFNDRIINLGTGWKHEEDIITVLIHEISEIIHLSLSNRFDDIDNDSFFFLFNHSKFTNHNEILVGTLIRNKLIKI